MVAASAWQRLAASAEAAPTAEPVGAARGADGYFFAWITMLPPSIASDAVSVSPAPNWLS